MTEKIEPGDIVRSDIWLEDALVIESIEPVEDGLVINGKTYNNAEYEDFEKIGVTLEKVERDYIPREKLEESK